MTQAEQIKQQFQELPAAIQEQLINELLSTYELNGQVLALAREEVSRQRKTKPCPHCQSEKIYKRGKQKGVQMYQCRECTKWYSETTGTPLWDIKLKWKWQAYIRCLQQGMTIRKAAIEVGISIQTSFDWRHKILASLPDIAPKVLTDVVECDEMELPISHKGNRNLERLPRKRGTDFKRNEFYDDITTVQIITAVQRKKGKYLKAVETKRLTSMEITKALEGKIAPETILITDKHPSFRTYAKSQTSVKHKTVLSKEHVSKTDKNIHLQHVNNTHAQLRKFLMPFNGVSTKYLQNYLNWFAYAGKMEESKTSLKTWLVTLLLSSTAYDLFLLFKANAVNIRT